MDRSAETSGEVPNDEGVATAAVHERITTLDQSWMLCHGVHGKTIFRTVNGVMSDDQKERSNQVQWQFISAFRFQAFSP